MLLIVPPMEEELYPTLGDQVCAFIEERCVYGPGSLKGRPAKLSSDQRLIIYRAYEYFPRGHERAGRRRFDRVGWSCRKGSAKTEFAAWIAYCELHPEAPVRFAGYEKDGSLLQGRPVNDPYIPMLANTQEQVAELAYGALMTVCELGMDPEYFDIGLDRIIRIGVDGSADGKALPIAGSPSARDGARTTHQCFDETHRLYLPSHRAAVDTMNANLPKRPTEDPWTLSTTTAGEPGQDSVAEDEFFEAEAISRGEIDNPTLFFFHRQASDGYDMDVMEDRLAAIREASGPDVAEWSDIHRIAAQWDRPRVDRAYLERVWCNRWSQQAAQAFDSKRWDALYRDERIPERAMVTVGFDGARMRDATGFVVTDIKTGLQQVEGVWERPRDAPEGWEVDEAEVNEKRREIFRRFRVVKLYADPPHWNYTVGDWAASYPDVVEEFWTNQRRRMYKAVEAFVDAIASGSVHHNSSPGDGVDMTSVGALTRHIRNAGRRSTNLVADDETGERVWILSKIHPDRKLDLSVAAVLSWQARMDVLPDVPKPRRRVVSRIR